MHARHRLRPRRFQRSASSEFGYSLVELLVVVGLIGTAAAVVIALPGASRTAAADAQMQRVIVGVRQARELAVAQRRNVAIEFPSNNQLRLVRQDVSGGIVTGTTDLGGFTLESGFEYRLFPGLPDTPDGFGNGAAQSFSGAVVVQFTSEGALVDQTGDPVNGTMFLGRQGDAGTARAVTILGSTGLVSGYRWNGREWTR